VPTNPSKDCSGSVVCDVDGDASVDDGESKAELDNDEASDLHASVDAGEDEIERRIRGREDNIA